MNLLSDASSGALPPWISEIKAGARTKIITTSFAEACRLGDRGVMRGLVVGLWPFIDEFPISMIRCASQLPRAILSIKREILNTLLYRGSQVLVGIKRDEENHRKLWLETGGALGLRFPGDFSREVLPETQAWIDAVNEESAPFIPLLRFAAIEMIAEIVSVDFLGAEAFASVIGEKGCEWFRVHAEHEPGLTHEELELRFAFAFSNEEITKETAEVVIYRIVDLAVAAMEASARLELNAQAILADK